MDKPIPFFYYDILARIVPGAATVATLHMLGKHLPNSWLVLFDGQQTWKAIVIPLALGAICYAIGVLYEAIDYSWPVKLLVWWIDDRAFSNAQRTFGDDEEAERVTSTHAPAEEARRSRFHLWNTLVFEGARDPGFSSVFAHCHRYQAEHKMFLHLAYPSLLLATLCFASHMPIQAVIIFFVLVPTLIYVSFRRNERRWLQALSSDNYLRQMNNPKPLPPRKDAEMGTRAGA